MAESPSTRRPEGTWGIHCGHVRVPVAGTWGGERVREEVTRSGRPPGRTPPTHHPNCSVIELKASSYDAPHGSSFRRRWPVGENSCAEGKPQPSPNQKKFQNSRSFPPPRLAAMGAVLHAPVLPCSVVNRVGWNGRARRAPSGCGGPWTTDRRVGGGGRSSMVLGLHEKQSRPRSRLGLRGCTVKVFWGGRTKGVQIQEVSWVGTFSAFDSPSVFFDFFG